MNNMFAGSEPPKYLVITKYLFNQILFTLFFCLIKIGSNQSTAPSITVQNVPQNVSHRIIKMKSKQNFVKNKFGGSPNIFVARIPRTCYQGIFESVFLFNFTKLQFLNDKIYSYTKNTYLALGNLILSFKICKIEK